MRKLMAVLLLVCCLLCLSGCRKQQPEGNPTIVAALFPEYDWTRRILGEQSSIALKLLIGNGTDSHSYQPTVSDMVAISDCDMLIFGGGESEEWLAEAAASSEKQPRIVVEMISLLGEHALSASYTEGMQIRAYEDETDEHFRLSLKCAQIFCREIAEVICQLDPDHAETYRENAEQYIRQLEELDAQYEAAVSSARSDTILVADRFPFLYLTADYGLNHYAAFPGCSAECGASFATMVFLSRKLQELDLKAVLIPEGSDGRMAQALAIGAGLPEDAVQTLNSLQSISQEAAQSTDYLTIMQQNLAVLQKALQ